MNPDDQVPTVVDVAEVSPTWITDRYGIVRGAVPDGVAVPSEFTTAQPVAVGTHGHDVICFGRSAMVRDRAYLVPAVELTARPGPDSATDCESRLAIYAARFGPTVIRTDGFCAVDRADPGFMVLLLFVPSDIVAARTNSPQQWFEDMVALAAGATG